MKQERPTNERGLHDLYRENAEKADQLLWGRRPHPTSRRGFLKQMGLASLCAALGSNIPFSRTMPAGLIPAAFSEDSEPFLLKGKDGLIVHNDRPFNLETPPHLLDDEVTPISRMFVRNNGQVPEMAIKRESKNWSLTIDGEVNRNIILTLDDLKKKFRHYTFQYVLECAGNGRIGFAPPTPGTQWGYGAIACPKWTGVRLKDVLSEAGIKSSAVYIGYYGHDIHLNGDPDKVVISRGVPISKAMDESTLLAFAMNGEELPTLHGFPLRLVCPGYPASASGKWLKRISVRDKIHDGTHMLDAYRIPTIPIVSGTVVPSEQMKIIEVMPVKSIITFPKSGTKIKKQESKNFHCRGFAWTGEKKVSRVDVSFDFGQTWLPAKLKEPANDFAWQRWEAEFSLPSEGYYEIWARAMDSTNKMQPMVIPGWNPKGYLNNAMPRIAVTVGPS